MNYTKNYNLKKPEGTDTYNIADFNGNMDIVDAQLHGMGNGWVEVPLSEFADMGHLVNFNGEAPSDQWTASIWYNSTTKTVKVHFYFTVVSVSFNTGHIIGTIKTLYLPAFEQFGCAVIESSNKQIIRPAKVSTDGAISIEKRFTQGLEDTIDYLDSLDITYVVA